MEGVFNPELWLQLGLGGAALLGVFALGYFLMKNNKETIDTTFKQFAEMQQRSLEMQNNSTIVQNKSIDQLCSKIDKLADTTSEVIKSLAITETRFNAEMTHNDNKLTGINDILKETNSKVGEINNKLDNMMKFKCKIEN